MFYGIENDNLSPLLFGAVFICLIRWWRAEVLTPALAVCRTDNVGDIPDELSNAPLLGVALCVVLLKVFWRFVQEISAGRCLDSVFRCVRHHTGRRLDHLDATRFRRRDRSSTHIALSGWTPKPFTTWWHHPIFTWQGAWNFLSKLLQVSGAASSTGTERD